MPSCVKQRNAARIAVAVQQTVASGAGVSGVAAERTGGAKRKRCPDTIPNPMAARVYAGPVATGRVGSEHHSLQEPA